MRRQEFIGYEQFDTSSGSNFAWLRGALLFGSILFALGLMVLPTIIDKINSQLSASLFQPKIDYSTTASIPRQGPPPPPPGKAPPPPPRSSLPLSLR